MLIALPHCMLIALPNPIQVKASAKEGVDYAWEHARQIEAEREERAAAAVTELAAQAREHEIAISNLETELTARMETRMQAAVSVR